MGIPERKNVNPQDTWDLSKLFSGDSEWENALLRLAAYAPSIEQYKGSLGESVDRLYSCLNVMNEVEQLDERLGYYAHLKIAENMSDSVNTDRWGRYLSVSTKIKTASSYLNPELQSIPDKEMNAFLQDPLLKDFLIILRKILRFKPHVLSVQEERLLSMQSEANETANKAFSSLNDADLDFGTIKTPDGDKPLSQSTFSSFLLAQDRSIREAAFHQFYARYEGHKNTLASLYNGSVQLDAYKAKVRNYPSARAMALFPDNVSESVYDNLIATVHDNLPSLHRYYALRKKVLGLDTLKHYDVYVPMISSIKTDYSYEKAVELIIPALAPLGEEYCATLQNGLLGRWVDKYENKGKRSGAFSAGSYHGDPYILMNYKPDVLRDVFTLAHEGGHSMHSWYSVRNNHFQHYNYTIFEAEVASTFNEQLLAKKLIAEAESTEMKAYLIGKLVDDIIATIYRQTMFTEFEAESHSIVEAGRPLTVDVLRKTYRGLLEQYFGPHMELEDVSDLEGLRIPHFYRAFYVYKYATGLSASIALSKRVLEGGSTEREDYLRFLKSGGSKYPLESLKLAGVDMSTPEPIANALHEFDMYVKTLETLI